MTARSPLFVALLSLAACKSAPELKPAGDPELSSQELIIAEQGLTDFRVRFEGKVRSPQAAILEKATYELVVDGKVVKSGEEPLSFAIPEGGEGPVSLEEGSRYVATAEELKAMDARGGSLLAAIRGKLFLHAGQKSWQLDYARSREIRVPRLLHAKLHELDGARYAADEVSVTFYLGVENPNPFAVKLTGLAYKIAISGRQLAEGTRGAGEKVGPSSTGVFEVQVPMNRESYGPEVAKAIQTLSLPYEVNGELKGDLFSEAYNLKGNIKLNVTK